MAAVPITGAERVGSRATARDFGGDGSFEGDEERRIYCSFLLIFYFLNMELKCEFHPIYPSSLLANGSQSLNSSQIFSEVVVWSVGRILQLDLVIYLLS